MATAKIVELDDTNTCKICDNALAKYSCPRCNLIYCSLVCYQNETHLECSEDFYKDSLFESLNLDRNDPESRAKMLEILQRTHENNKILDEELPDVDEDWEDLDSDDNEDIDDMTKRFENIDLDNAEKVWEVLTEDERQEFVAFLRSEDISKLIPSWEPWWLYCNKNKVVEVEDVEFEAHKEKCPKIGAIKEFSSITKKTPADCVRFNLHNILASYVFTTRYFNGEHHDFAKEAASCWASLSLSIKAKENFADQEMAIKSVEHEIINSDWIQSDQENIKIMQEDLERILEGPNLAEPKFYILCCLSDIGQLLDKTINQQENPKNSEFHKTFPDNQFPNVKVETKENLLAYHKKIDYFLSYVNDLYN